MSINKDALHDELTSAFIVYQYRIENPMPKIDETKEYMENMYLRNSFFNRRVQSLVCGVMCIVDKHIEGE